MTTSLPANSIEMNYGDGDAKHAVVWLHGLGATANDFPPIVPELGLSNSRPVRFIFPQAPNRPITINGGMLMPAWYDIKGMSIEEKQDLLGMTESKQMLDSIIDSLLDQGIESQRIVLAGFSQGGAVSYYTAVRSHRKIAGVLALSTYLPFDKDTARQQSGVNLRMPIFASHGDADPVVPLEMGRQSVRVLEDLGYSVDWRSYPMEHQLHMQQVKDIGQWLNRVFDEPE